MSHRHIAVLQNCAVAASNACDPAIHSLTHGSRCHSVLSTRALLHRNSWHTSRPGKACTVLDECAFAIFGSIWLNCYNVARIPPWKQAVCSCSYWWICRLCGPSTRVGDYVSTKFNKIKKHFLAEATCRSIRCFFDCALLYSQEGAKIGQIDADWCRLYSTIRKFIQSPSAL